jgi:hypothetical protein
MKRLNQLKTSISYCIGNTEEYSKPVPSMALFGEAFSLKKVRGALGGV